MHPISLPANVAQDIEIPPPGTPLLWRVSSVASMLGIATETLEADIDAGRLDIRAVRYGARRLMYLNAGDVVAHLRTIAAARKQQGVAA